MQTFWFNYEAGRFYLQNKEYGAALKKLSNIEKHYADIEEDQLDFHHYCLRKYTLRAYVDTIRLEDNLYGKQNYVEACLLLAQTYLELHKNVPSSLELSKKIEEEIKDFSAQDRKNHLIKKKKEDRKKEEEREKAISVKKQQWRSKYGPNKPFDEDPEGQKLVDADGRLEKAAKYISTLQKYASKDVRVHILATNIYIEKKKPFLALRSLKKAHEIAPSNPSLHLSTLAFFQFITKNEKEIEPVCMKIINAERSTLFGNASSPEDLNSIFLKNHSSFLSRVAAAQGLYLLDPQKNKEEAIKMASNFGGLSATASDLTQVIHAYRSLQTFASKEELESFRKTASELFPYASVFN